MSSSSTVPKLPWIVSPLALKIALPLGVLTGGAVFFAPSVPTWTPLATGVGMAGLAYAIGHVLLHRRLNQLQSNLRQMRRGDFENLTPPSQSSADELDVLLQEVYRTAQSLENEIQELKEMENYRREFIGNVSHELKTPIFSVQGFTETLLEGALEDEDVNRTFLEKILHNVNRLENLARDLTTITKIETDELEMSFDELDVEELFEAALDSVEVKAAEKEITLETDVPPDLPTAYGDRDRLRRVLVNLADNAIKYNENGGYVRLCASAQEDEIEVRVVDDGIGISSDHLPRLTERFYRVDKSRSRNQGGTGLGLAIVKHILAAHDREPQIESTQGEGSTFYFTLPTGPQSTLEPATSA